MFEYTPQRLVVLSELSTREKEAYYQLLIQSNSKFYFDPNLQKYVANVRLLAPNVKKSLFIPKKKVESVSLPFEERLKRLNEGGSITVHISGIETFDYSAYIRFVSLISSNGDIVKPKARSLLWVMRSVEDLLDARFAFEQMDIERNVDDSGLDGVNNKMLNIFPVFIVKRLSTLVGLKSLVDNMCWDLLYNLHRFRSTYLEAELFIRFVQEHYDHDDLLFLLYVRSVVCKILNISLKSRWRLSSSAPNKKGATSGGKGPPGSTSTWMSYREAVRITNTVFGNGNEQMCKEFLSVITSQMVGQKTASSDSRRIDITNFLHLAVAGYHQTQLNGGNAFYNGGGDREDELRAIEQADLQTEDNMGVDGSGHYEGLSADGGVFGYNNENEDQNQQQQLEYTDYDQDYYYQSDPSEHTQLTPAMYNNVGQEHVEPHQEDAKTDSLDAQLEQMVLEHTLQQQELQQKQLQSDDGEGQGPVTGESATEDEEEHFVQLQLDREQEYLEFLCDPLLEHFSAATCQNVIDELADQLRSKVNEALHGYQPDTLQDFDNALVSILQSDELLASLENIRNVMVSYISEDGGQVPQLTQEEQVKADASSVNNQVEEHTDQVLELTDKVSDNGSESADNWQGPGFVPHSGGDPFAYQNDKDIIYTDTDTSVTSLSVGNLTQPTGTGASRQEGQIPTPKRRMTPVTNAQDSDSSPRRRSFESGFAFDESSTGDVRSAVGETDVSGATGVYHGDEISGTSGPYVSESESMMVTDSDVAGENTDASNGLVHSDQVQSEALSADEQGQGQTSELYQLKQQFDEIQQEREQEFLTVLCEPLMDPSSGIAQEDLSNIMYYLADYLRKKMNGSLEGFQAENLAHFDDALVSILQSDTLMEEMEDLCTSLTENLEGYSSAGEVSGGQSDGQ